MRRVFLFLAFVLVTALASAETYIRYYPPQVTLTSSGSAFFESGISLGNTSASPYANLYGDAANTLAQRNGGVAATPVPQTFNIYNFCDGAACATGYEVGKIFWASSAFQIQTAAAGTGSARDMLLNVGAGNSIVLTAAVMRPTTTNATNLGNTSIFYHSAFISTSLQGSRSKSLTDAAAAVSFVRIAVPTNSNMGGKVIYTATSTDGANGSLTSTAEYNFSGSDIAGTVTCGISAQLGVATAYARANTLVCTVTTVTSTTNCDLQVTCTDNKAAAQTVAFNWRLDMPIANTVTPQ